MSEPLVEGEGRTRSAERKRLGNATGRQDWSTWPAYDAAVVGFENYWYPTVWSRDVMVTSPSRSRSSASRSCWSAIMVVSTPCMTGARIVASHCPWRVQGARGTISCRYHGWSFDLATGEMPCAALSPMGPSRASTVGSRYVPRLPYSRGATPASSGSTSGVRMPQCLP